MSAAIAILEVERNPALMYLASLRVTGRRSMASRLARVARMLGHDADPKSLNWASLRFEHVDAIRSRLQEEGCAPASVNATLSALRGVARSAWSVGLMTAEEYQRVASVRSVRGFRLPGRALNQGEVIALLDICAADASAAGARDAAIVALLLGGGLRRSEAAALTLADYDSEAQAVKVIGKGNKERLTYLDGGATSALKDWITMRGDWPGPLLCPVRKGGKVEPRGMSDQSIYGALVKRSKSARVQSFSPHDLRRTFASELIDASGDLSAVQQLLGHSNIQTTSRYDRRGEKAKQRTARMLHLPYRTRFS